MSDSGEIPAGDLPDWLPAGFTMEVKTMNGKNFKSYIHHLTGKRFYSKPKVLEYINTVENNSWTPQKEIVQSASDINLPERINGTAGSDSHGCVTAKPQENGLDSDKNCEIGASEMLETEKMDSENSADWLPVGWTEEFKVKNGRTVKNYVDPLWGHVFGSKLQVLEYLGTLTNNNCTAQKETADVSSESNLPDGWIIEIKPRKSGPRAGYPDKIYIDPVTGRKFMSKQKVFEYLGIVEPNSSTSQRKQTNNMDETEGVTPPPQIVESPNVKALDDVFHSSTSKERSCRMRLRRKTKVDEGDGGTPPPQLVESQNVETLNHTGYSSISKETSSSEKPGRMIGMKQLSPEGLPSGWIREIKTQKTAHGTRSISYFVDPVNGYVFASQKDAWRYLKAGDISKCVKRPKKRGEMGFVSLPLKTKDSTKSLPDGWITETKPRKSGSRAGYPDKQYIDPVSGYVFTSLIDAWRYIEAGDISKCVKKPKKREEGQFATEQSPVASPAVMHKIERDTTEKQLSTANVGSKRSIETTDTDFSSKRRQTRASTPPCRFSNSLVDVASCEQSLTSEVENSGKYSEDASFHQFGDETWSNLDYTIEALTGTLPFEDNASVQNIFQTKVDTSQVKTDYGCSTLMNFGKPEIPQVINSHDLNDSEATVKSAPVTHSPTSPVFLPDMNCTLPSGSKAAPSKLPWKKTAKMTRLNLL